MILSELLNLPTGSQVFNAADTRSILSGSSDNSLVHLIVNLDSKPFLDTIFPASKNRTIQIDAGAVV